MTNHEKLKKVGKDLEALAEENSFCIAAVVMDSNGDGVTTVANLSASTPVVLVQATKALETYALKFVEQNAPEVYDAIKQEAEPEEKENRTGTPLRRTGWFNME